MCVQASEAFLQRMVALYASSHYKNTPNDLILMSDAPAHHLFALLGPVDETQVGPLLMPLVQHTHPFWCWWKLMLPLSGGLMDVPICAYKKLSYPVSPGLLAFGLYCSCGNACLCLTLLRWLPTLTSPTESTCQGGKPEKQGQAQASIATRAIQTRFCWSCDRLRLCWLCFLLLSVVSRALA